MERVESRKEYMMSCKGRKKERKGEGCGCVEKTENSKKKVRKLRRGIQTDGQRKRERTRAQKGGKREKEGRREERKQGGEKKREGMKT